MFDFVTISILVGLLLILGGAATILCVRRYEFAIALITLSPWVSALFLYISPNPEGLQESTMGSYIRVGTLLVVGLAGVIRFIQDSADRDDKVPLQFKLFGFLLVFALISTIYSIAPFFTLVRAISFLAVFGFLLGLYSWLKDDLRMRATLDVLFYTVLFISVVNVASIFLLGDAVWHGEEVRRFRGLWGHPNSLGSFAMVSYFIFLWKYRSSSSLQKWQIIALIGILAVTHLLTGSRSSMLLAVVGIVLWSILSGQRAKLIIIVSVVSILAILVIPRTRLLTRLERTTASGESYTTLTGRTDFWTGGFQLLVERPFTGYGYGVGGKIWTDPRFHDPDLELWSGSTKTSLHNGYISIAIGLGVLGLLIYAVVCFVPLGQIKLLPQSDYKAFIVTFILVSLILNFVESTLDASASFTGIIFWMAWTMSAKLSRCSFQIAFPGIRHGNQHSV